MEIILSILVSTYNRVELFQKNINRMLECNAREVEFIVCDNASTDHTWDVMSKIEDSRVSVVRNEFNYGFDNFWRLSFLARGNYFMFVNDRDFIEAQDIEILVQNLKTIEEVDFISNEKRNYLPGYYTYQDAPDIYFQSRHPGTLIYRREFCRRIIDREVIEQLLKEDMPQKANNYLVFQLLKNVEKVYVYPKNIICQPRNRERIPQVRKEYYNSTYISLEYRVREYEDWIAYGITQLSEARTRDIMLSIYKDSLMTVTWEFYISMNIPGFAKRAHFEEHSGKEWVINGFIFFIKVFMNKEFRKFKLHKEILDATWKNFLTTAKRVQE